MKVSIIAIGDELLIGQVVDTNSGTIAREINPDGWAIESIRVVADAADQIEHAVRQALSSLPADSALPKTTLQKKRSEKSLEAK